MIQTPHTYVLVKDSGESALASWLDELARAGVPTPAVGALSRGSRRVRVIVRPVAIDEPTSRLER